MSETPTPISEETVSRISYIMGDGSAAKQALDKAKNIRASGGHPEFFTHGPYILVKNTTGTAN